MISIIWYGFYGGENSLFNFFFSVTDGQNDNS